MSAEVLKIIRGIAQAAANTYDGALDAEGNPVKVGLKREEGDPILDQRIMDGFTVSLAGNMMIVKYNSELPLKDIHRSNYEDDVNSRIEDIVSFIKKEYKKVTGDSLTLTKEEKDADILIQPLSRIRSMVQAKCAYTVAGLTKGENLGTTVEERLNDYIKQWIGFGKKTYDDGPKVKNITGTRDEEPRK